jgi:hypothetical protein
MSKARIAADQDPETLGSAIVSAWFKVLPDSQIAVQTITAGPTTSVTTKPDHRFRDGDLVYFYGIKGMTELNGPTYRVSQAATDSFTIEAEGGGPVDSSSFGVYATGTGHVGLSLRGTENELRTVLDGLLDPAIRYNLIFDPQVENEITIVIPQPPKLTRQDLIDYLMEFHRTAQGQHYHEDLGTAVLFGCGH